VSADRFVAALAVCAALIAARPPLATAEEVERRSVELLVGQQISVPAKGVIKYSEGVEGIVDVRLPKDGGEFIVVGLKAGTSTLLLIYDGGEKVEYQFTVKPLDSDVPRKENVRLDFYFVELSDTDSSQLGALWPASYGAGATVDANLDLISGDREATLQITGHALPRLDLLQAAGWAKVARHGVVIAANGSQAAYSSGGEVNIAVQGSLAAEIRRIEFGSRLKVLPRFDPASGRIEMTIEAEFSSLSSGGAVPGRSVSTLQTIVNVDMGQAVALAGIDARADGVDKEGLPLLSQIPVLGLLFGRRSARSESVQNVVFIVPSVVDVVSMAARARLDEALEVYSDFDGGLEGPVLIEAAPRQRPVRGRRRRAR
jgi:pilus assembly protein CpaC